MSFEKLKKKKFQNISTEWRFLKKPTCKNSSFLVTVLVRKPLVKINFYRRFT
jgi:hypothetical protein